MKSDIVKEKNSDQIIPILEIEKIFSDFYSKVFDIINEIDVDLSKKNSPQTPEKAFNIERSFRK